MKKSILTVALLAIAGSGFAQSKFDGFYVQGGAGFDKYDTNSSGTVTSTAGTPPAGTYTLSTNVDYKNDLKGNLGLGYGFSVNNKYVVSVGIDYVTDTKYSTNTLVGTGYTASSTGKVKDKFTYYVAPGYLLNKESMVYGKVGFTTANDVNDGDKNKLDGMAYGVGYKQFIDSNLYYFVEGSYIKLKTDNQTGPGVSYTGSYSTSNKTDGYSAFVGIGYKF